MTKDNLSPTSQERSKESREKILLTALKLFAEQGYEKTSTREIASLANVNLSSIKYYFGDKASLYRAAYKEPMNSNVQHDISLFINEPTIEKALIGVFKGFLAPLKENQNVQLCIKLHMREMLEPTGVWAEEIQNELVPYHQALTQVLQKELGSHIKQDVLNRLTFSILSLGIFLYVGQDPIRHIDKSLVDSHDSLDLWIERLVSYALAMIETEKKIGAKND